MLISVAKCKVTLFPFYLSHLLTWTERIPDPLPTSHKLTYFGNSKISFFKTDNIRKESSPGRYTY